MEAGSSVPSRSLALALLGTIVLLGDAPGCCRPPGTNIVLTIDDFNCFSTPAASPLIPQTVWARLESASSVCTPYSVTYED
jgi:hypothetical protein